jgi:transcriptional regulator with XRE-family HTH domain
MVKFKIKEMRAKKGMSQTELANKVGVHKQQLYRWEKNMQNPSIDSLCIIADVLELTVDELIEYRKVQGKISDEYTKMINEKEDEN